MKLKVTAKKEGFRRAGKEWSEAGEIIDTTSKIWSAKKVQALNDEPMLVVSEVVKKKLTAAEKKKAEEDAKALEDATKKAAEETGE